MAIVGNRRSAPGIGLTGVGFSDPIGVRERLGAKGRLDSGKERGHWGKERTLAGTGTFSKGSDLGASLFLPSVGECGFIEGMPRRLRLQYPGAIYHLMARGNTATISKGSDLGASLPSVGECAPTLTPPVPWRDLPPDGPRQQSPISKGSDLGASLFLPSVGECKISKGSDLGASLFLPSVGECGLISPRGQTYLEGVRPRSKFILAIRWRVWFYRGHAPTLTPPVPWRDLPPDGPRQRPSGHRMR